MTEPRKSDNWTGGLLVTGSSEIGYTIPDWREGTSGYIEYQEQSAMSQNSEWVDHVYEGDEPQAFLRALLNIDHAVNCRLVSAHLVQKDGTQSMPGGSFGGPAAGGERPERFDTGAGSFAPGGVVIPDTEDGDGDAPAAEGGTSGTSGTAPVPGPPRSKGRR